MRRIVADLGNTRLKWGELAETGQVEGVLALSADDPSAWEAVWADGPSRWAISSVNPPAAKQLERFLAARGVTDIRWYRSAVEVPVRHGLLHPESTGADRALAVAAAVANAPAGRPGQVVLCGTAITVERVSAEGVWQGGAIAPGLALSARALHARTAQLPEVVPQTVPNAWGNATGPALEAGIFWGVVGAIRELIKAQAVGLGEEPWVIWSGGDAERLAPHVSDGPPRIVPNLVLVGLAAAAFGARP